METKKEKVFNIIKNLSELVWEKVFVIYGKFTIFS